jgi:hypothetical protein
MIDKKIFNYNIYDELTYIEIVKSIEKLYRTSKFYLEWLKTIDRTTCKATRINE